eukprot:1693461-Alexandrium_andersonii.AAC.1
MGVSTSHSYKIDALSWGGPALRLARLQVAAAAAAATPWELLPPQLPPGRGHMGGPRPAGTRPGLQRRAY